MFKLGPISIGYLGDALKLKNPRAIVESYAVWGGIPRYWELVTKSRGTFFEKIDKIVLDPMGPLHEEPGRLLLEESAMSLRPILDAIGLGNHRLSEVGGKIGQGATSLVRPIQRLLELDLIQREHPYGSEENNSKRTLYKIKDPFLRFWFTVVAPRRSWLSQVSSSIRIQMLKGALVGLFAATWEELCRQAVPFLAHKLGGECFGGAERFWQGQGPEWDVVAQTQDGKTVLIGEVKWLSKTATPRLIHATVNAMKQKGVPPIERHPHGKTIYVLFVPEKPKGLKLPADVKVVEAKEVIHVLQ